MQILRKVIQTIKEDSCCPGRNNMTRPSVIQIRNFTSWTNWIRDATDVITGWYFVEEDCFSGCTYLLWYAILQATEKNLIVLHKWSCLMYKWLPTLRGNNYAHYYRMRGLKIGIYVQNINAFIHRRSDLKLYQNSLRYIKLSYKCLWNIRAFYKGCEKKATIWILRFIVVICGAFIVSNLAITLT